MVPLIKEISRQIRTYIDIDKKEKQLKKGMLINAEIEFVRRENARTIPIISMVSRDNSQSVFLSDLKNKRAFFTPKKTGKILTETEEQAGCPQKNAWSSGPGR